jgi:hypothetical protein
MRIDADITVLLCSSTEPAAAVYFEHSNHLPSQRCRIPRIIDDISLCRLCSWYHDN